MSLEPPPPEDSPDLTQEEVDSAVDTLSVDDLASKLAVIVKEEGPPQKHELRRKGSSLYCRTTFLNKVLLLRVNWLGV